MLRFDQRKKEVRLILLVSLVVGVGGGTFWIGFPQESLGVIQRVGTADDVGNRDSPDTLLVSKKGIPHATPLTGFNQNWLALPVDDERFLDTLQTFEPDLIRYPGGGVSDYWNWREGGLELAKLPSKRRAWRKVFKHDPKGLEELKTVLESTGAKPVFVLNALTSTLNEQREMLNTAAEKGIEVKYLEMGNEYFFDEEAHLQQFPSAENYAKRMTQWADVLKQNFPGVKISAVGGFADRGYSTRRRNWNSVVREHFSGRDAVSFHPYMIINEDFSTREEGVEFLSKLPWKTQHRAHDLGFKNFPSTERIWITEYNALGKSHYRSNLRQTWMHGLLVAAQSLLLMQNEQVEMILPHQITGQEALHRAIETPNWGGGYAVTKYGKVIRHLFRIMNDYSTVQSLAINWKGTSDRREYRKVGIVGNLFGDCNAAFVNIGRDKLIVQPSEFIVGDKFLYEKISPENILGYEKGGKEIIKKRGVTSDTIEIPPFSVISIKGK